MKFYYVQIKDRHDPGVSIRKNLSVASVNKAGGSGGSCSETLSRDFRGKNTVRKLSGPKGHLD